MKKGERFLRDEPEKYFAVSLGWTLQAISVKRKEGTWLMVIKVCMIPPLDQVAFIEMATYYLCWDYLYLALTTKSAPLVWRVDKWGR